MLDLPEHGSAVSGFRGAGFPGTHEATVLPLSRINGPFMWAPSALMSRVSWSLREAPVVLRRAGALWMEANRVATAKILSWSEGLEPALVTIEDTRAMEIKG